MATTSASTKNYLNNKDILREIHLSKNSYCTFLDPINDHQYDIILPTVSKINVRTIAEARKNRAARLEKETGQEINPRTIPHTDLVFRVMTWEHIPLAPKRIPKSKKKKKTVEDILQDFDIEEELPAIEAEIEDVVLDEKHVKVNFPPFWHYRLDADKNPYVVGKSHWKGSLENGEFCKDHGAMTRGLAAMFMALCERYATRWNWRGYCVDYDTEALTDLGWTRVGNINAAKRILSFNPKTQKMTWSKIKSVYQDHDYDGPMFRLTGKQIDALITPGHKMVTEQGLVPAELLTSNSRLQVMGFTSIMTAGTWSQELSLKLQLVKYLVNYQSRVHNYVYHGNDKVFTQTMIDMYLPKDTVQPFWKILDSLNINYLKENSVIISDEGIQVLYQLFNGIYPTLDSLLAMPGVSSFDLHEVFLHCITNVKTFCPLTEEWKINFIQELGAYLGYPTQTKLHYNQRTMTTKVSIAFQRERTIRAGSLNFHGSFVTNKNHRGQGKVTHPNVPVTHYRGLVWCPETEYGCFVARRKGKVYLTGNTYNDEMRGQALLHLSQIGLQFNESKSLNPFGYYTTAITNSFTRIWITEKKNQNIRDDILELNGLNASWSRQYSERGQRDDQ